MLVTLDGIAPVFDAARVYIAPNATLIGGVTLGLDASVWFGAVLRGDSEPIVVGERSNIQDLCVLHTDPGFPLVIGANCTIGHQAMLHGCTIGDNCLIGIQAIVLNGARIGRNCLIGAGALVTEGMIIPDNSMVVGMPGKVKREERASRMSCWELSISEYSFTGSPPVAPGRATPNCAANPAKRLMLPSPARGCIRLSAAYRGGPSTSTASATANIASGSQISSRTSAASTRTS